MIRRPPVSNRTAPRFPDTPRCRSKASDEVFEDFKGTTGSADNWAIAIAGKPPADAPWHDGAIRYLKEKGVWDAEAQAWQDKRLARLQTVMAAWADATEQFDQ